MMVIVLVVAIGLCSLARAVYYNAAVALLDDLLLTVDSHVFKHIVNQYSRGPVVDRTRVCEYLHFFLYFRARTLLN